MKHDGFHFQWMFVQDGQTPLPADERALEFLASFGFNLGASPSITAFGPKILIT